MALAIVVLVGTLLPVGPAAAADHVQLTGVLRVVSADDFQGRSAELYWLETATGTVPIVFPPGTVAPAVGTVLLVTGTRGTGGTVRVTAAQSLAEPEAPSRATYTPPTAPTRSILVIISDFTDMAGDAVTPEQAEATFTGAGSTVQAFFAAASRGRVATTSTVVGPWSLGIASTCDPGAVWTAGDAVAVAHGIDPNAYDHVVVWTRQPPCAWWAGVGGGDRVWITQDFPSGYPDAIAYMTAIASHELGHDLGLAHALTLYCEDGARHQVSLGGTCQADPYVDPFSNMGDAYSYYPLFDSEELRELGWLYPVEGAEIASVGTYSLVPTYSGLAGVRLLRVRRGSILASVEAGSWTLEIRSQLAGAFDRFDPTSTTVSDGVTVRFAESLRLDEFGPAGPTYLLDMTPTGTADDTGSIEDAPLLPGQTFTDSAGGLTFSVDSVGAIGALVTIGDTAPPSAPGALIATDGIGSVRLDWGAATDNLGLAGYVVRRDGAQVVTLPATALGYTDTGVTPGATHVYGVTAIDTAGLESPAVSATAAVPTVPGAPTGVVATPGDGSAAISWSAPGSNGGRPITSYTATASPDRAQCSTTGALGCTVTGLVNGTGYTFTVIASNAVGTGPASEPSPGVIPRNLPTASITPLPTWLTTTSVPLRWTGTPAEAANTSYDVRYRRAPWNGGFGSFVTWRSATTATSGTFAATRGSTYCFSARVRDALGSVSPWTAETCTGIPLDDRSLVRSSSWTAGTGTAYYAGTYLRSSTYGAKLTRTGVVARRIAIVATTCRGCGTVRVYWGSTLLRTISLNSATTVNRKLISVATFASARSGTLKIKVSTSGRKVIIDGVAIRRN